MSRATASGPRGFVSVLVPKDSSHQVLSSSLEGSSFFSSGVSSFSSSPSFFSGGGGGSILGLQCSTFSKPRSLNLIWLLPSRLKSTVNGENLMTASNLDDGPYCTVICVLSWEATLASLSRPSPPTITHCSASL